MLMKSPKKGIALILAKMKGPQVEEKSVVQDGETAQDSSIALDSAAEEVLASIERKDPKALKDALVSLVQMCMDEEEAYKEDSKEEESEV